MSSLGKGSYFRRILLWSNDYGGYYWGPSNSPSSGNVLTWNGSEVVWAAASGGGTLAGDVTGAIGSNTVVRIQGRSVASTAPTNGQVLTYNTSTVRWEPATPSGVSFTESVVAGRTLTGWDVPVILDENWNTSTGGLRAYSTANTSAFSTGVEVEPSFNWLGCPTQPYCFVACAIRSDLYLVAYRFVSGGNTYLRLRAISYGGFGLTVGSPLDLSPDGASNEVAYVACCRANGQIGDAPGGLVAWANPTTSKGYIVSLSFSGTTITASSVSTFSNTAVEGIGVSTQDRSGNGAGYSTFLVIWADSATNLGKGRSGLANIAGSPSISYGSAAAKTWTSLASAKIGMPVIDTFYQNRAYVSYGVNERRVCMISFSYNPPDPNTQVTPWTESRIDGFQEYAGVPGYLLSSDTEGSGTWFSQRSAVCLLPTSLAGYGGRLNISSVEQGHPFALGFDPWVTLSTKFGSADRGTKFHARRMTDRSGVVSYIGTTGSMGVGQLMLSNKNYEVSLVSGGGGVPYGTGAQNGRVFRISNFMYGELRSFAWSWAPTTYYFTLELSTFIDVRRFAGIVRLSSSSASEGTTVTLYKPGSTYTFADTTSAATWWKANAPVYLSVSPYIFRTENGLFRIGRCTSTPYQMVIEDPSQVDFV